MRADLVILTPLKAEAEPLLARLGPADGSPLPLPAPACVRSYRVGPARVLAGWTGIGGEATARVIEALGADPPRALLHAGVAGGLSPSLRTGDLVVCDRLLLDRHDDAPVFERAGAPFDAWLAGVPTVRGAGLTVERVVTSAAHKRALFERTGAAVVEMESWHAARAAEAVDVPFVAVRAVCDGHDASLPDLTSALDPVGRPRTLRLLRHLVARPGTISTLPRVALSFAGAQRALVRLVAAVLDGLRSGGGRRPA